MCDNCFDPNKLSVRLDIYQPRDRYGDYCDKRRFKVEIIYDGTTVDSDYIDLEDLKE